MILRFNFKFESISLFRIIIVMLENNDVEAQIDGVSDIVAECQLFYIQQIDISILEIKNIFTIVTIAM